MLPSFLFIPCSNVNLPMFGWPNPYLKIILITPPTPLYFLPFLRVLILRFSWFSKGIIKVTLLTKWQNLDSSSNFQPLHEALSSTSKEVTSTIWPRYSLKSTETTHLMCDQALNTFYTILSNLPPIMSLHMPIVSSSGNTKKKCTLNLQYAKSESESELSSNL